MPRDPIMIHSTHRQVAHLMGQMLHTPLAATSAATPTAMPVATSAATMPVAAAAAAAVHIAQARPGAGSCTLVRAGTRVARAGVRAVVCSL